MLCFPNCKINIGLYVTRRREDGYHDIETVFYPLSAETPARADMVLHDVVEVVPAKETQIHLTGRAIAGNDTGNLVWKAYLLLHGKFPDKVTPADIYLHKLVPMGAGLGGGSADGAFMLRLLNDYCRLQLSDAELATFALQLGSDCPFFIYNKPQFAAGRGEQMTSISLALPAYSIQLICPRLHVSTAQAFKMITPGPAGYDLRQLPALPVEDWKAHISNDFEAPVFQQYPVLAGIKGQLYGQGAVFAAMSGSGSAIFGIFPKNTKAIVETTIAFEEFFIA